MTYTYICLLTLLILSVSYAEEAKHPSCFASRCPNNWVCNRLTNECADAASMPHLDTCQFCSANKTCGDWVWMEKQGEKCFSDSIIPPSTLTTDANSEIEQGKHASKPHNNDGDIALGPHAPKPASEPLSGEGGDIALGPHAPKPASEPVSNEGGDIALGPHAPKPASEPLSGEGGDIALGPHAPKPPTEPVSNEGGNIALGPHAPKPSSEPLSGEGGNIALGTHASKPPSEPLFDDAHIERAPEAPAPPSGDGIERAPEAPTPPPEELNLDGGH
jgi:hypothetical protein